MLKHCAACPERFKHLNTGRLFAIGDRVRTEWFWLCGKCATHLEIREVGGQVIVAPRKPPTAFRRVA